MSILRWCSSRLSTSIIRKIRKSFFAELLRDLILVLEEDDSYTTIVGSLGSQTVRERHREKIFCELQHREENLNGADLPMLPLQLVRPKVAEHAFHLFGRSVHPELFQTYQRRIVDRKNYWARIDITSDGHVATFKSGSVTVSEVVCSASQLLPVRRQIRSQSFRKKCTRLVELRTMSAIRLSSKSNKCRRSFSGSFISSLPKPTNPTDCARFFLPAVFFRTARSAIS